MKKKIKFFIPSLITLIILLILYYNQGLYPFDNNSIVQVDADYQFIPVLYRVYDFLHGNLNIFYDDIGLGNNIYVSMIIQGSIFSPISLLLYFTERSNIVYYFNIILLVKFCLLSLTSYIYINKTYKVNEFYKILFSILYTFSGWVLLNYFNIMWMDSVILFPLIILYLNKLLEEEKYLGYVITLSLSLMISYYISYYIILFILFYSFVYIFIKLKGDRVKNIIFKLGIYTFISILISSFSLVPALYQTLSSSRIGSTYTSGLFDNFMNKSLFIIFSSVFVFIFILLVLKFKKDKKNIYCYLILLILFGIGMFIEPINLGIHMGSYWSFPYRYSFITLFILMGGSLYYLENYEFKGYKNYQVIRFIIFILFGCLLLYLNNIYVDDIVDGLIMLDFKDFDIYKDILIVFLIIIMMCILSFTFSNKYLKYISFCIVCILQIYVYSGYTMYYGDGYFLSTRANNINNNMNLVRDDLSRYKMGFFTYSPDYAFISKVNTLDNWLHILPENEIEIYRRIGYKNTDTCVRSYGGTIFSDWLFNVKYLINDKALEYSMFSFLDDYEEFNLYKYNYYSGFGLIYNKDFKDEDYEYLSMFELQNNMYKELLDKDEDIIDIEEYYLDVSDNEVKILYNINEEGYLYLNTYYDISYITVNDNYIDFDKNGYIIDLGIYNKDVEIVLGIENTNYIDFSIGYIKNTDVLNLNSNVRDVKKLDNGYDIRVDNDKEKGYLFLPINNISGLTAMVNGKDRKIESYLDNFVSIKLDAGENDIQIRYETPYFKLGILLSIIGILCLVFFSKIKINNIILNITCYIYIFICFVFYLYYYAYPFIKYYNYK